MTVTLSHRELGTGPPVVILHGLFGSKANWRSVAGLLAGRRRVYLVDQRNHGDAEHAATMTYREMAGDLAAWMDEIPIDRASVIGHSMGGKTGMIFAEAYPARTGALVVADIAPVSYEHDHGGLVSAMRGLDLAGVRSRREADARLAPAVPDDDLRAFLLHNLVRAGSGLEWRINLPGIEAGMRGLLSFPPAPAGDRFRGPALFVRGESSGYVPAGALPRIRERFPAARFASIPGAGHWLHVERPERFVAVVEPFLDEAAGSADPAAGGGAGPGRRASPADESSPNET